MKTLNSRNFFWILFLLILCPISFAENKDFKVPLAKNLQAEGKIADNEKVPLVVFFSRPDCPFCLRVESRNFKALTRDGATPAGTKFKLVQIHQGEKAKLIGFDGLPTTHSLFAEKSNVQIFPVVAFYNGAGEVLYPPINGAMIDEFYQGFLERGIDEAQKKIGSK